MRIIGLFYRPIEGVHVIIIIPNLAKSRLIGILNISSPLTLTKNCFIAPVGQTGEMDIKFFFK